MKQDLMKLEVNLGMEDPLLSVGVAEQWELAIDYLKGALDGLCLENDVVRLVISQDGFYYEFLDTPECFYGATRPVIGECISDEQAIQALFEALSLYRSGEGRVMVVYGPHYQHDDDHIFLGQYLGLEPIERGTPKLERPMFFRVDVDALETSPLIGTAKGTALLVRTTEGENILLRLPQDGQTTAIMLGIRE